MLTEIIENYLHYIDNLFINIDHPTIRRLKQIAFATRGNKKTSIHWRVNLHNIVTQKVDRSKPT